MASSRVTVVIVTWNSAYFLPDCLLALRATAAVPVVLQVVDNASSDDSVAVVRELFPDARLLRNVRNTGFCRAVNQGIKLARTEYVLLLTPDVVVSPSCLAALVAWADMHPCAGSAGPLLLRREKNVAAGVVTREPDAGSWVIDALGITINRARVARNAGEGTVLKHLPSRPFAVFGCSGACVLYRRRALAAVAVDGEYVDEDFFMYKEDVDLAWRLRLGGFSAWCVPAAVAWHVRQLRQGQGGVLARWRQRRAVPARLRRFSFVNHHLMLVKNEQGPNLWRDFPWVAWRVVLRLLLGLTLEPFLWRHGLSVFRQVKSAWRKRRIVQRQAIATPVQIRQWFLRENPNSKENFLNFEF